MENKNELMKHYIRHAYLIVFNGYNRKYNEEWDTALNKLLDMVEDNADVDVVLSAYTLRIGKYEVWISNKWYSYGYLYNPYLNSSDRETMEFRPKLKTMLRLDRIVQQIRSLHKTSIQQKCIEIDEYVSEINKGGSYER